MQNMQNIAQTVYDNTQQAAQNFMNSLEPMLERLAGTHSEVKLNFEDLTLDTGTVKAKIQGYILLSADFTNPDQNKTQTKPPTQVSQTREGTETKTVVTNVTME